MASKTMSKTYKKHLIVGSVSFLSYFITLFGTFVFDDGEAIVKNKDVMPYTPIGDVFANDFWGTNITLELSHKSYRPLTILTYRINVILANNQLNAFHFHATNVILYSILSVMIIPFTKLFMGDNHRKEIPYFTALLFAVHPIHCEVVAGLVGRADILSGIAFLLSLFLYKHYLFTQNLIYYLLTLIMIGVGVFCKEIAITALALCSIYDVLLLNLNRKTFLKILINHRSFVWRNLGLCGAGLAILYLRLYVMDFKGPIFTKIDNPAAYADDVFTKVFTYNYIYFLNVLLLLWPEWLCFDWSMGCVPLITQFCDIRVVLVFIFWLNLLFILIYSLRGKLDKSIIFGLSLIVFPFIPASNLFIKVGFVIAERTLLIPSVGFCFLVASGVKNLERRLSKIITKRLFYALCVIFTIRTIQRNANWLNEESLFTSALSVCPLNAKVHYNVAKVAGDKHNKVLAVQEYLRAIELNPNYEQAMNNLANLLREEKRFKDAELLLRKALDVRPNFAAAWMNLGIVLTNLNETKEAESCYLTAISFRPKYPDCYYNLGNLYLDLKRNDDALKAWEMAVKYRPTHTAAWSNTLVLLDSLNKYEQVLVIGRNALMYNPKAPALHFSIANTLGKIQEFEKAEKHFLEALNFNPYNALYYSNLGVLYHRWGKTTKALEMYKKALQLDPSMKTTEKNLKKLLNAQNNTN